MTPNSVRQLAPSSVYSPPAIHKKRIVDGAWSCSATTPGVRRIPTPIVPPTLTARPKPRPRTRRSWPDVPDAIRARSITRNDLENTCDLCAAWRATSNYDARGAINAAGAESFRIPEASRVAQHCLSRRHASAWRDTVRQLFGRPDVCAPTHAGTLTTGRALLTMRAKPCGPAADLR